MDIDEINFEKLVEYLDKDLNLEKICKFLYGEDTHILVDSLSIQVYNILYNLGVDWQHYNFISIFDVKL